MRKHFLILMLFALLPLAGWSQQISIADFTFTITSATFEYTGAGVDVGAELRNPAVIAPLVEGTDYDLVFAKDGVDLDEAPIARGTYTVRPVGKGGYTGTKDPVQIVITAKSIAEATVTDFVYTACRTSSPASATYDGNAWEPTATLSLAGYTFNAETDYDITYQDNINAGDATITYTGKGNFTGTKSQTFSIAKANIPATAYNAPTLSADLKYTGNAQNLITAGSFKANTPNYGTFKYAFKLHAATDYSTPSATVPTGTNADTYDVKWMIEGTSNYNDVVLANVGTGSVTIGKAENKLRIYAIAEEKTYDGKGFKLADARFTITGWADGDNTSVQNTLTGVVAKLESDLTATETGKDYVVDGYSIVVDEAAAVYKTNVPLSQNYDIVTKGTTWTINKRDLTVTASSAQITYGQPVPYIENEYTPVAGGSNLVGGKTYYTEEAGVYTPYVAEGTETSVAADTYYELTHAATITLTPGAGQIVGEETPLAGYTLVYGTYGETPVTDFVGGATNVPLGVYANAFKVKVPDTPDADAANYTITPANGTLTVVGGAYNVIVTIPNTIQYDTQIVPSFIAVDDDENDVVVVAKDAETTIAYIFETAAGVAVNGVPTTLGDYRVKVDANTIKAEGNFAGGEAKCAWTYFGIVPKNVNVTLAEVSLYNGATKAMLNSKKTDILSDFASQIKDGESITVELDFDEAVYANIVGTTGYDETKLGLNDGKLVFPTEYNAAGTQVIVAKILEEGNYYQNYELVFVNGVLKQNTSLALALDASNTDNTAKIEEAAANSNQKYNVTLKLNRGTKTIASYDDGWRAFQWNALILPFDITVKDLSNALGYAIVNVINPAGAGRYASGTGKVAFKLKMDNEPIPANTPIMVKTFDAYATDAAPVNFGAQYIKAATNDLTVDASTTESGLGFKFMGTYTGVHMDKTKSAYQFLVNSDTYNNLQFINSELTFDIIPFNAYFYIPAEAGVREMEISFEELDGSTTTIRQFAVENTNFSAEGWYNLNGVKMQGVPTEKGVYIQNGKKVVIK